MTIGSVVEIQPNTTHPRLAGRTGVIVAMTPELKRCGNNGERRRQRCGNHPIVVVDGERYLLSRDAVRVVERGERAA